MMIKMKRKSDKLDGYVNISAYSNTDAMIDDKMFRMQLVAARKAKHLTQKELSRLSGLSESCISNIESGESSSPTLRSLIKYTNALGVELSVIYSGKIISED